jgi:hypothetical protein
MEAVKNQNITDRIERLERSVARHRLVEAIAIPLAITALGMSAAVRPSQAVEPKREAAGLLRVRGLVVEDAAGHPRIVLGEPALAIEGRKRKDSTNALVFLDEKGVDRAAFGYQLDPQIAGKVVPRKAAAVGMNIYDAAGNERGGFGFLESGAVVLGLDTAEGREGASLAVDDGGRASTLMMASRKGGFERIGLYVDDERALVKIGDVQGAERIVMMAPGTEKPQMLLLDAAHEKQTNLIEKLER